MYVQRWFKLNHFRTMDGNIHMHKHTHGCHRMVKETNQLSSLFLLLQGFIVVNKPIYLYYWQVLFLADL